MSARTLRRAEQSEQFGIKAPLSRLAHHFHGQNRRPFPTRDAVEAGWVVVTEAFHDHGLAHATVAVNGDRGHPRSSGVVNQAIEMIEGLLCARIEDPAAGFDSPNPLVAGL